MLIRWHSMILNDFLSHSWAVSSVRTFMENNLYFWCAKEENLGYFIIDDTLSFVLMMAKNVIYTCHELKICYIIQYCF